MHRCQAHRAIELHPIISHFFRFWVWLTTGMVTKEWAAIHRKHHAFADKPGDPYSPHIFGIGKMLAEGTELYQKESKNIETLVNYGSGTPEDWIERNVYTKHDKLGILLMFIIDLGLFGEIGITIWAIQMLWIPLTAAGVINGLAVLYAQVLKEDVTEKITKLREYAGNKLSWPNMKKLIVKDPMGGQVQSFSR